MREQRAAMADALADLKLQMKIAHLWPNMPPTFGALQSTAPFAVDTMDFESWLAFIFIPKMEAVIQSGGNLPDMKIYPAAEMYLSSDAKLVLSCIEQIDAIAASAQRG